MKRHTLLLVSGLFMLGMSLQAQVTVQSSDLPSPGDLLRYSISDTFPALTDVSASQGSGLTFDYNFLNPAAQRTDSFVSINAVPIQIRIFFPFSANLALYIETPDSVAGFGLGSGYQVYQSSSGAYVNLGFGGTLSGIPISLVNNPTDTVFTFPLSVGASDSSVSTATLDVPNLLYYSQSRKRIWQADADGQLQTPFGNFASVRVHSWVSGRDSVALDTIQFGFAIPMQENYNWYSPDHPGSLLQVTISGQDSTVQVVSNVSYADSLRDVFQIGLDIERSLARPLTMYPNPARDRVHMELPDRFLEATVTMYALDGRTVWRGPLAVGHSTIQLPSLPGGLYQVVVEMENNLYQGKLLIE